MAIGRPIPDLSQTFNSVYAITQDVSGWDKVTIQTVAPMVGTVFIYGTNDSGSLFSVRQGNATLATNFTPIQAVNLATGVATNTISAAGLYRATVDAQFLRLQGSPAAAGASVYKILLFNSKVD